MPTSFALYIHRAIFDSNPNKVTGSDMLLFSSEHQKFQIRYKVKKIKVFCKYEQVTEPVLRSDAPLYDSQFQNFEEEY